MSILVDTGMERMLFDLGFGYHVIEKLNITNMVWIRVRKQGACFILNETNVTMMLIKNNYRVISVIVDNSEKNFQEKSPHATCNRNYMP